jgi:sporulation integral membrane protein YtvI
LGAFLNKKTIIYIITFILLVLIGFWILPVALPIVFALLTAMVLEPVVRMLRKRLRMNRHLTIIIVFSVYVLFLGVTGYFTVTKVITEVARLVENSPAYITEISSAWDQFDEKMENYTRDLPAEVVVQMNTRVEDFLQRTKNRLLNLDYIGFATKAMALIPNYLVSIIVYLIALFLFMIDLPKLKERFYAHLKPKSAEKVHFMTARFSHVTLGFFKAQFLVSIIIFIASLIGLYLIAPDVALIMSLIIWVVDFIPFIGSIIILGPWAVYQLIVGGFALGTQLAILAIILLTIRRTVEPKVMGKQIGLSALSTLISMYIGLKLFGIAGIIIGPGLIIAFNSAREAGIIKFNFKV